MNTEITTNLLSTSRARSDSDDLEQIFGNKIVDYVAVSPYKPKPAIYLSYNDVIEYLENFFKAKELRITNLIDFAKSKDLGFKTNALYFELLEILSLCGTTSTSALVFGDIHHMSQRVLRKYGMKNTIRNVVMKNTIKSDDDPLYTVTETSLMNSKEIYTKDLFDVLETQYDFVLMLSNLGATKSGLDEYKLSISMLSKIAVMMNHLQKGGDFVLKIGKSECIATSKLLYVLSMCFESISISTPLSGYGVEITQYVICKSYKYEKDERIKNIINLILDLLFRFKNLPSSSYIIDMFVNLSIEKGFLKKLSEHNSIVSNNRIIQLHLSMNPTKNKEVKEALEKYYYSKYLA